MASDESVTSQQVEIKVEPTDETTDEKPSTDTRVTTQETIQDTTQSHQPTMYTQDTTQSHQVQPTMYTAISTRPPLPNGANFGHCLTPTMGPPLNPAFFAPLYSSFKELTADQSGQLRLVNPGLVPVPVPSTIAQQHIPIAQPQVPIAQPLAVESTRYDWSDEKTKFLVTIWRDMYRRLNSATSNKLKLKLYTEMHKNFTRVFPGNLTIVQMKTKLRGIGNQYKEKKKSLASTTGICDNYSDFMDQSLFDELDLFLDDKKGSKKSDTTPPVVTENPSRVVLRASASAAVESIAGIPSKGLPQRRVRRRNSGAEDVADLVKQYIKRDEEFSNEILRRMDNMTNRFIEANERQTDRFLAGLREILRD